MGNPLFFYSLSGITIIAAVGVVFFANPLSSAISLVITLAGLAGLFVLLEAHFLAAIQVLVYAGAVMVLFIFVIMMFNLRDFKKQMKVTFASILGLIIALNLAILLMMRLAPADLLSGEITEGYGTVRQVGKLLLTEYLIPFEIVSLLLTVAAVGAVVLAKREGK